MRHEVKNEIGNVMAVFWRKSDAEEYAGIKGYTVTDISPEYCPSYQKWCKCDFAGVQEVEIDGVSYYQKGRM